MFLQVSVILFMGGMPGPGRVTGPGVVPGLGGSAPGGCLHLGVPGPGGVCSRGVPSGDPPDSYCYGRYASYWNAFLLKIGLCPEKAPYNLLCPALYCCCSMKLDQSNCIVHINVFVRSLEIGVLCT